MPDSRFFAESPAEVGIDPDKIEALFQRAEREVRDGLLPSVQIAVARNGKYTIGAASVAGPCGMVCLMFAATPITVKRRGSESMSSVMTLSTGSRAAKCRSANR